MASGEMTIKAIIFDCDGVLLDSNRAYLSVFSALCRRYGVRVGYKAIFTHFGAHPKEILKKIMAESYTENIFTEYKREVSSAAFLRKIKLTAHAKTLLKRLQCSYKLALVSGAIRLSLIPSIKKFGLQKFFCLIISGDDVAHAKPHPEMLVKAMKVLHIKPDETLYIGDAPNDVKMAKAANVRIVVPTTGVLSAVEARKLKADFIIRDLQQLVQVLNKIS